MTAYDQNTSFANPALSGSFRPELAIRFSCGGSPRESGLLDLIRGRHSAFAYDAGPRVAEVMFLRAPAFNP